MGEKRFSLMRKASSLSRLMCSGKSEVSASSVASGRMSGCKDKNCEPESPEVHVRQDSEAKAEVDEDEDSVWRAIL